MVRRETKEVEFNAAQLQGWIGTEYRGQRYSFPSLIDRLRRDGFLIDTPDERAEVLAAINALMKMNTVTIQEITADATTVEKLYCQFKIN